jgi:hypothetical protein
LIALLVPAVQKVREAAARTQCRNNLKQIGLAFHGFHGQYRWFPPARIADNGASDGFATWFLLILPHIEQEGLYKTWDLTKSYVQNVMPTGTFNHTTQIPTYYCPSRRPPTFISQPGATPAIDNGIFGALGDYAGCAGVDYQTDIANVNNFKNPRVARGAVITGIRNATGTWFGQIKFSMITDGTSNTFLVGEKHVPSVIEFGTQNGDHTIYNGNDGRVFCRVAGPAVGGNGPWGLVEREYNTNNPGQVFGSWHPNICQFVLCDGSVRSLNNGTDVTVLSYLAMRDDGQVIPALE